MYDHIRYETVAPHVVALTLARPERLNALSGPLLDELADAVARIDADADVRVFLLRGAPRPDGRPCFSAGVDLRAFPEGKGVTEAQGLGLTDRIDDLRTPSIAVIDGVCTTGGAELVLACDFRIAARSAQISDWHLKHLGTGLGAWGASTRWVRLVGAARTKEILLTGKVLDGEEAHRIGFSSAVCDSGALEAEALAMAETIAGMAPEGVALTLSHLDRVAEMTREQSLRFAELAPRWQGVRVEIEGKDEVLARGK
jgi:enoyl-CoA hydratase/carnithine racemase